MAEADIAPGSIAIIAVTAGPGSFTGIRAALSLAHGIGMVAGAPVVGVTVGEALALSDAGCVAGRRELWVAVDSRRGRVFLDRAGQVATVALDALPDPSGPVCLAGDAAIAVASRLAARGADVMLLAARVPTPAGIAAAAQRRTAAGPDARPTQPLYVDPPEARPAART